MAYTPWLTSDDLIASIKRKISFPVYQSTFTEEELLDFATEEMMISQVPSVLSFHEEYYATTEDVPLVENKKRYPLPERAIGMKLRDLFLKDSNGNLFEMTRISQDDRGYFQRQSGGSNGVHKYFLEGNDIVLANDSVVEGNSLVFVYFIRPSRLVKNERAAIIEGFTKTVTVTNASVVAGDTVTVNGTVFTAVAGSASTNEFQIGGTSIVTATNLAAAITVADIVDSAGTGSPATNVITIQYEELDTDIETSNSTGFAIQETQGIAFTSVPANIENGSTVDFLQTRPGHKIRRTDIRLGSNVVSETAITFDSDDVPEDLVVGDYVCLANESIVPYLPTDLHTGLAERTCARILAAIGDTQGLAATNEKIAEIEIRQGNILDNRVEGSNKKIRARNSLIALGKIGRRRF
jgi:hypothetical protein